MATGNKLHSFGIHQAVIHDLDTYEMFQILVLDSAEPDFTQELIDLRGGSSAFPWASAPGEATGEIKMTIKEYSPGILKYFSPWVSGSVTETSAGESGGYVVAPTDVIGTSVVNATTGIASIAAAISGGMKYGDYVIKAVGANTIDIYVNTSVDGHVYLDDTLKVAAAVVIPGSGGTVDALGLTFTGGSGTIALTTNDVAIFTARSVNNYYMVHQIGKIGSSPKEFGLTLVGEKVGNKIRVAHYPKCISSGGAGLKFLYKDWATFETKIKILQDPVSQFVGQEFFLNR